MTMETEIQDLKKMVTELREVVDNIESDLSDDRSKLDKILNEQEAMDIRMSSLEKRMPRLEDKFEDALRKVLRPIKEEVEKVVTVSQKLSIWKRIFKRGGGMQ